MTNQPAEGTFSRLMATTAPIREKQREEQEKATRPPGATVTSPIMETPTATKREEPTGSWQKTHKPTNTHKQQCLATR
jgi:hypothetical protein